jgi:hypothetical protein
MISLGSGFAVVTDRPATFIGAVSWIDFLGFLAALTVLAIFCMTTIIALRLLALMSNVLFVLYGWRAHIYPVLVLHLILFPVNLFKLQTSPNKAKSYTRKSLNLAVRVLLTAIAFAFPVLHVHCPGDPADQKEAIVSYGD